MGNIAKIWRVATYVPFKSKILPVRWARHVTREDLPRQAETEAIPRTSYSQCSLGYSTVGYCVTRIQSTRKHTDTRLVTALAESAPRLSQAQQARYCICSGCAKAWRRIRNKNISTLKYHILAYVSFETFWDFLRLNLRQEKVRHFATPFPYLRACLHFAFREFSFSNR